MRGLFITGTDTGVGKTLVTATAVRACRAAGLRVGAYKPVCSGRDLEADGLAAWPDVAALSDALEGEFPDDHICPQRFDAPLAPPSAARQAGRTVDAARLRDGVDWWREQVDLLFVEGVGGLLCPLTENETVASLAIDLGYPVVIVCGLGLGAINHTLLTIEVAQQRGLQVAGLILNHVPRGRRADSIHRSSHDAHSSSLHEIQARSPVPILAITEEVQAPELHPPEVLFKIDWQAIAAVPHST